MLINSTVKYSNWIWWMIGKSRVFMMESVTLHFVLVTLYSYIMNHLLIYLTRHCLRHVGNKGLLVSLSYFHGLTKYSSPLSFALSSVPFLYTDTPILKRKQASCGKAASEESIKKAFPASKGHVVRDTTYTCQRRRGCCWRCLWANGSTSCHRCWLRETMNAFGLLVVSSYSKSL